MKIVTQYRRLDFTMAAITVHAKKNSQNIFPQR